MADELQFDKVEPQSGEDPERGNVACVQCGETLHEAYYTVNQRTTCASCKVKIEAAFAPDAPGGRQRFMRALLMGALTAAGGALAYYAIYAITSAQLAIVTIFIGYFVGKVVAKESGGRGGWAYQLLAMGLTYLAMVSIFVPEIVKELSKQSPVPGGPVATSTIVLSATSTTAEAVAKEIQKALEDAPPPTTGEKVLGLVIATVAITVIAMIAPIAAGFENIIGMLILAFGLWEAWKQNRRVVLSVEGPFKISHAIPTPMPGAPP